MVNLPDIVSCPQRHGPLSDDGYGIPCTAYDFVFPSSISGQVDLRPRRRCNISTVFINDPVEPLLSENIGLWDIILRDEQMGSLAQMATSQASGSTAFEVGRGGGKTVRDAILSAQKPSRFTL